MSETNFPTDNESSIDRLEAVNDIFQLNELQSGREEKCAFLRIHDTRITRTISQIRRAQSRIAVERSAIACAIARNKIAECRNTRARTREWVLKK